MFIQAYLYILQQLSIIESRMNLFSIYLFIQYIILAINQYYWLLFNVNVRKSIIMATTLVCLIAVFKLRVVGLHLHATCFYVSNIIDIG